MTPPFTTEQFFEVFAQYHWAVGPAPVVLLTIALAATAIAARPTIGSGRAICGLLAVLWLWMGIVYHGLFFARLTPGARLFAGMFVLQAIFFVLHAWRGRPVFRSRPDLGGIAGGTLIAFALVAYPFLALALGHRYPRTPSFGLPCPTTIFTLGILLWSSNPRAWLAAIPSLWAVIGTTAAFRFGVREDLGLGAALLLFWISLAVRRKSKHTISRASRRSNVAVVTAHLPRLR